MSFPMKQEQPGFSGASALSPFPEGWYYLATRRAVERAGLIQKTWMGADIVIWCDDEGNVCVAEAYCPHLGSGLGPSAGGQVRDGRLVCPFHGFEYDTAGHCVATPYADAPRNARLRVFETRQILGMIFAWWGIDGRPPQWNLPSGHLDQLGWSGLRIQTLCFPGHPQETTENSVDLAHLRYVHGYGSVDRVQRVSIDGPRLESHFDFRSVRRVAGVFNLPLDLSARTNVHGLGYSYVEITEHTMGMSLRLWVLATPVDGTLIDLSLASQVGPIRNPSGWMAGLRFLPSRMRAPIVNRFMSAFQREDVLQDVTIWSRKRYLNRPRLCRSDGEIMQFRAFCTQFYIDSREAPAGPDAAAVELKAS